MLNIKIKNLYQLLLCCTLFLVGCATTANYQKVINNWQGTNAEALVNTWGNPNAKVKLANGNTVYLYTREHIVAVSAPAVPATNFTTVGNTPILGHGFSEFSGATRKLYCNTLFEVNSQGLIVSTSFQGNNCVSNRANGLIP